MFPVREMPHLPLLRDVHAVIRNLFVRHVLLSLGSEFRFSGYEAFFCDGFKEIVEYKYAAPDLYVNF